MGDYEIISRIEMGLHHSVGAVESPVLNGDDQQVAESEQTHLCGGARLNRVQEAISMCSHYTNARKLDWPCGPVIQTRRLR